MARPPIVPFAPGQGPPFVVRGTDVTTPAESVTGAGLPTTLAAIGQGTALARLKAEIDRAEAARAFRELQIQQGQQRLTQSQAEHERKVAADQALGEARDRNATTREQSLVLRESIDDRMQKLRDVDYELKQQALTTKKEQDPLTTQLLKDRSELLQQIVDFRNKYESLAGRPERPAREKLLSDYIIRANQFLGPMNIAATQEQKMTLARYLRDVDIAESEGTEPPPPPSITTPTGQSINLRDIAEGIGRMFRPSTQAAPSPPPPPAPTPSRVGASPFPTPQPRQPPPRSNIVGQAVKCSLLTPQELADFQAKGGYCEP